MENSTIPSNAPSRDPFHTLLELERELPTNPVFEKSFVAYLDILGFKEFVEKAGENAPKLMTDVYRSFRFMRGSDYRFNSIEHRMFSDSIMIWCSHKNPHSWWNFVNQVELVREMFGKHGLLLRGGISYGDHFCAAEVVVSSALIKAYQLEQTAVFPRIRVDDAIFDLPDMLVRPASSGAFLVWHENMALMVSPGKVRADGEGETCLCPFRYNSNIRYLLTGNTESRMPEDAEYTVEQLEAFAEAGLGSLKTYKETLMAHRGSLGPNTLTAVQIKINYLVREYNAVVQACQISNEQKDLLNI